MDDFGFWTMEDARKGRCQLEDVGDPRELEIPPEPNPPETGDSRFSTPPADETPEQRDIRHRLELGEITPALAEKALGDLKSGRLSTSAALALAQRVRSALTAQDAAKAAEGPPLWNAAAFEAIRATSFPWLSPDRLSYQDDDPEALATPEPLKSLEWPVPAAPEASPPVTWKPADPFTAAAAARDGAKLD